LPGMLLRWRNLFFFLATYGHPPLLLLFPPSRRDGHKEGRTPFSLPRKFFSPSSGLARVNASFLPSSRRCSRCSSLSPESRGGQGASFPSVGVSSSSTAAQADSFSFFLLIGRSPPGLESGWLPSFWRRCRERRRDFLLPPPLDEGGRWAFSSFFFLLSFMVGFFYLQKHVFLFSG